VFIATRHDLHAGFVLAALRAGKHVFVEKPLCIQLDELNRIEACIQELRDRCPLLTVGFNRRFAPATRTLRNFFGNIAPLSLSYRFAPGSIPADHWTQDTEVGGGRIVGEACHAIDTCVAMAGSPVARVYAESVAGAGGVATTDDRVFITIRHRNGSISSISYQAGGDPAFPAERIEVFGGGRTAVIDSWNEIQLWNGNGCRKVSGKKDKGHAAEFGAFLSACKDGGGWPIPWEQLQNVTWASLAAVQSLREGFPLEAQS
jgi:predicted dehydrogenase